MAINITLRQLEAFRAVAEVKHFGAASKRIHLSQPALSLSIRKLEEAIGAQLFDRDTRNVQLTAEGEEMLSAVSALLKDFASAFENVKDYIARQRGRVTVATSPSLGGGFLSRVIAELKKTHPQIEVRIIDTLAQTSTELVNSGLADLALTTNQQLPSDLVYRELFTEQLVVLCRFDHPIALQKSVSWTNVGKYDHITLAHGSAVRRHVESIFLQVGHMFRPVYEVEHAGTIIGLVCAGLGISILPFMATRTIGHPDVIWKPVRRPNIERSVGVVTHKSRSLSPPARALVDVCVAHASL